jgi:hypothetical protein
MTQWMNTTMSKPVFCNKDVAFSKKARLKLRHPGFLFFVAAVPHPAPIYP